MSREDNLVHFTSDQDHDKAVENGRKGGKRSGEVRKRKKEIRELTESMLAMPLKSGKVYSVDQIKNLAAVKGKNLTVEEAILLKQVMRALSGSESAAKFVLELAGYQPETKITAEVTTTQREPLSKLTMEELKDIINDAE